ncbi:hypothetical protein HYE68_008941 [Fusarium pseudograminearum]|nr:hypothetical protein HYE68_008941 [Fusarium pseudograminearum]
MGLFKRLVFLAALFCNGVAAQSFASVLTEAPQCAADCLVTLFSEEPFAGKNQSAICHDQQFADAIGNCLTAKCTVRQTLDFIKMSSAVCRIKPTNNVLLYRLTTLIMAGLALLFFALRIIATVRLRLKWAMDDTMAVASVVLLIPVVIIMQFMMQNGLGVDLWYLSDHQITEGFRLFFFLEMLYLTARVLVKSTILCFFLRIFSNPRFRLIVKITLVFNVLIGVTFFILVFFQTTPISLFWIGWQTKEAKRVMLGIIRLTLPHAVLVLALDIWVLILPITQLWELGLKLRKKIGVMAMFSFGIFLTVVAVIRVDQLVLFARSRDLTGKFTKHPKDDLTNRTVINAQKAMIWSCIEISVGIMVSCMPHIRNLVRHIKSRIREKRGKEKEPSNEAVFIQRSLVPISVGDATSEPALFDEGDAITTVSTTIGTGKMESINGRSSSYASDADTQV